MMSKKTLILIAAVAVMLIGATSASAYYEAWDGWFNSGFLTLFGDARFDYVEGEGRLEDRTYGSVDSFFVNTVTPGTFTCESDPYQGWTIKLWPGASGSKPTGQRGTKEVEDGEWTGKVILYIPTTPPQIVEFDSVWGTWNTIEVEGDCFNYWGIPHMYSAHWRVSYSVPGGIGGYGGSAGDRIDYSP